MFSAADARAIIPSQAEIRFQKDLNTNLEIIQRVARGGGHEATLYDGYDRERMVSVLLAAGYYVVNPPSGCLKAQW